ncbi:MGMT family protein [Bacillus horti]|nr:MGMT family protein [Bacillus horti]
MQPFTQKVISIIKLIPAGKVMSYGQIASLAGSPRGARQVVRILHSMSKKYQLPWHRVINSKGEIGLRDSDSFERQRFLLESEGIEFLGEKVVDLEKFSYVPSLDISTEELF